MEKEDYFDHVDDAFLNIPDNFSVLEEQINVETQMKYFRFSEKMKDRKPDDPFEFEREELFNHGMSVNRKKKILVTLASSGQVADYRLIEKYLENPEEELKDWAVLALQEARMLLQSSLLDEQQVFISTGLGGKGKKIRYYSAFLPKNLEKGFSEVQKKVLANELEMGLQKYDGELEKIIHLHELSWAFFMIPLKSPVHVFIDELVSEINQYGDFLDDDIIVTNIKKLTIEEIFQYIAEKNQNNTQ